jgi:PAS domain S-box-containing protein
MADRPDPTSPADETNEESEIVRAIRRGSIDAVVLGEEHVLVLDSARALDRLLIERMPQGAVTVAADGTVVYANEQFRTLVGMQQGALVGVPLASLVAPADGTALRGMLGGQATAQAELMVCQPEGKLARVRVTMAALEDYWLFLFDDLTVRKKHEAIDRGTGRFLSMLAQEFADMLGPMEGTALRLRESLTDPDALAEVALLERQHRRMRVLVDELRRVHDAG